MAIYYDVFDTVFGEMYLAVTNNGLCKIGYPNKAQEAKEWMIKAMPEEIFIEGDSHLLSAAKIQLIEYMVGNIKSFDLPIDVMGTVFQKEVWNRLSIIPYGMTMTYKEIAIVLGGSHYARAVGGAIGRNPIPIVLPCHRVVGTDNKMTGYAGGIELKKRLLQLELDAARDHC